MPLEWKDGLLTGVKEIDDQHKEILNRINKLRTAAKEGKGREIIEEIMSFLEDYIKNHFGLEERYMQSYNYPMMGHHISQHNELIKGYQEIKKELQSGQAFLATIMANDFLGQWWIKHIVGVDKGLANFLRERLKV